MYIAESMMFCFLGASEQNSLGFYHRSPWRRMPVGNGLTGGRCVGATRSTRNPWENGGLPSGKHTQNYGTSPFYSWVNQLFLWPCSITMLVYQRVHLPNFGWKWEE